MGVDALIEQLKTIPNWRRGRTVQYPLWLMLLMTLLGVMSGYSSLRGLEDFMKRHQREVAEWLGLSKAKRPSYCTLRRMTAQVDAQKVAEIFLLWAKQSCPLQEGAVISMDGKALGRTVRDCCGQQHDFVTVVSACVQQHDWVIGQVSFHNGEGSEISSVRQLLQHLEVSGVWVTLDALHTQKNGL